MSFDHALQPGETINNAALTEIFQCSSQGGMRRSLKTNTLVIVSNHTKKLYEDRWDSSGVLHYTGMGMDGDQQIDFAQNKTLAESNRNGVDVYLFEVFQSGLYTFIGKVELASTPYQEQQPDKNGVVRTVWIFPVRLADRNVEVSLSLNLIKEKEERRRREAKRLTDSELGKRVEFSSSKSLARSVTTSYYERNPYVAELAKRRARGTCQLCGNPAPFRDKQGNPYLESHHIEWLSQGGEDSVWNTVALCPNCHTKMHVLALKNDKKYLQALVSEMIQ